jgi:REP element-mobilizing transposase RayT
MKCLLGAVLKEKMCYSPFGVIASEEWQRSAELRPEIKLDEFIVMPNHFHAIVWIKSPPTSQMQIKSGPKAGSIGAIIAQFKAASTRRVNIMRNAPGATFWQRNYYDRVIRNEDELNQTRHYIQLNPYQWAEDEYHH